MHVKNKSGLDDVYNFKTFGQSMILLFQVSRRVSFILKWTHEKSLQEEKISKQK